MNKKHLFPQFYAITGYYSTSGSSLGKNGSLLSALKGAYSVIADNIGWTVLLFLLLLLLFMLYKIYRRWRQESLNLKQPSAAFNKPI